MGDRHNKTPTWWMLLTKHDSEAFTRDGTILRHKPVRGRLWVGELHRQVRAGKQSPD